MEESQRHWEHKIETISQGDHGRVGDENGNDDEQGDDRDTERPLEEMNSEKDGGGQQHVDECGDAARNIGLDAIVEKALDVISMEIHAGHRPFWTVVVVEHITDRRVCIVSWPGCTIAADQHDAMVEQGERLRIAFVHLERGYVGEV